MTAADGLAPPHPFHGKLVNLPIKILHDLNGLLYRRRKLAALPMPACHSFRLLLAAALLSVNLFADLALGGQPVCSINKLHATGFTHPILAVAMLAKVSPLPVATGEEVLFEETHV